MVSILGNSIEGLGAVLRQFVQEEHAAMGQGDFAGARYAPIDST